MGCDMSCVANELQMGSKGYPRDVMSLMRHLLMERETPNDIFGKSRSFYD
jgi:hypothetical protein